MRKNDWMRSQRKVDWIGTVINLAVLGMYILIFFIVYDGVQNMTPSLLNNMPRIEALELKVKGLEDKIIELENKVDELEDEPEAVNVVSEAEVVQARVTAYAPLDNKSGICAEGDPTVTATGTKVRRGIIAVDPKKIPYGSKVFIPGYGEAIAEDTGGALRRYDGVAIDILVDSYEEAMKWGKQHIEVVILERGGNDE